MDCVKTISPQWTGTTHQLWSKQNRKGEEGQSPLCLSQDGPPPQASRQQSSQCVGFRPQIQLHQLLSWSFCLQMADHGTLWPP